MIAKQQDSCDKTAGNGGQNMPMLQGPKIGRSLRGKPFTFDSHQPQSHLKQQARSAAAAARPQSHPRQQAQRAAAAGRAPQSPKRQARSAEAAAGTRARNSHVPPHISPAAPTNNGPVADRLQQRHRRRGPGLVFRTLRRPVWRLVRGSEGAGQGATHGRGRSEN